MDERSASGRTPLLLHACCGPCSLEPVRLLREEGFEPTICWVNPNIQPVAEHDLRLRVLRDWAARVAHVDVIVGADDRDGWERLVAPAAFDRGRRCRACYTLRLAETCRIARARGFSHVSTTLAVSPYQLFDACEDALVTLARAQGLRAVWRDVRDRYPDAVRGARELGMYRQSYCGCRFSAAEAARARHAARDHDDDVLSTIRSSRTDAGAAARAGRVLTEASPSRLVTGT